MRFRVASRSRRQSPKGDVTGPHGMLPMVARAVDDKPSDTLVVGSRQTVLDGEFDSPPSPPDDPASSARGGSAGGRFVVLVAPREPARTGIDAPRRPVEPERELVEAHLDVRFRILVQEPIEVLWFDADAPFDCRC